MHAANAHMHHRRHFEQPQAHAPERRPGQLGPLQPDRAHRIGQQNVVTSIKLVARDTVEQRVLDMQDKKRALLTELLDPENSATPALDADELVHLIG
jgi:hypothetical protein